jgi:hypothetical protein
VLPRVITPGLSRATAADALAARAAALEQPENGVRAEIRADSVEIEFPLELCDD